MVALKTTGLALGAIFVLPGAAARLFRRADLGPLNGTDPRVLNGTCPSVDKNTTCAAPAPLQFKELLCGNYDTGSKKDLQHHILERDKWRFAYNSNATDEVCPVPAQTCRRFGCYRTTGMFVCNHNRHGLRLRCLEEVGEAAKMVGAGCCRRQGTWASDGISGHLTTDQGWKVVVAWADCAKPGLDAVLPAYTGNFFNTRCENATDGWGDDEGIPYTQYAGISGGLYPTPTATYKFTQEIVPTGVKPEIAWSMTTKKNSTANSTAAATLAKPANATAPAPTSALANTTFLGTGATAVPGRTSGSGTALVIRTGGDARTTAAADSTTAAEGAKARVTSHAVELATAEGSAAEDGETEEWLLSF